MKILKKKWTIILFFLFLFPFISTSSLLLNNQTANYPSSEMKNADIIYGIDFSELPLIDYDTLNNSWYNPNIEMIIVAPEGRSDFYTALEPLKEWKNQKGVRTVILNNYSLYEGRDTQEKIRNMIKSFYESDNIRWVLLAGDAQSDLIPIRDVFNPDTVVIGGSEFFGFSEYDKPTDYYYADLTSTWDDDNDDIFGERAKYNSNGVDEIDWIPEVYVGRLPANDATELGNMVQKTLKYEKNPYIGNWMNQMLLAGGVSDSIAQEPPDGEDEARITDYIIQNYVKEEINYTHLARWVYYEPPEPKENLNNTNFKNYFDQGYSTIFLASHGNPTTFSDIFGTIFTSVQAQNVSNTNMPSLVYGDACSTSSYDMNDGNIGEILIKHSDKGAIGYVGALRVTWYITNDDGLDMMNRANARFFWREFYVEKKFQQGRALYDSKVYYMNTDYFKYGRDIFSNIDEEGADRKNLLTYCLLGDPEVDVYTGPISEAINPFEATYYEGGLLNITVKDQFNRIVPYPRVLLKTNSGIYHTEYGYKNGTTLIRLPSGAGIIYNVSITGHNLIMSNFSFSTLADIEDPEIVSFNLTPQNPKITSKLNFIICTQDNESGIEGVFILFSHNNFSTYNYYRCPNNYLSDQRDFSYEIQYLEPGDYSYLYIIRDYLNHTDMIYNSSFKFTIPIPVTYYYIIGGIIGIVSVTLISIYTVNKTIKKNSSR